MTQPNLTSLPSSPRPASGTATLTAAPPADATLDRPGRPQVGQVPAAHTPSAALVWRHRLILTGRLDRGTAVELEDEIDCLREEGVGALTLDLHELDAIDSVGARAVASRGDGCRRAGLGFTVIPGVPGVRRALVEAGAEGLMAEDTDCGIAEVRLSPELLHGAPGGTSTVMTKSL